MNDEITLIKKLDALRDRHRDLDQTINTISSGQAFDQLQLARLKKEKLMLRDQIIRLEQQVYPDIIA